MRVRCKFLFAGLLLLVAACGGGGGGGGFQPPGSTPTPGAYSIAVPSSAAYLGAWVNPQGLADPHGAAQATQTAALESAMGRTLAVHMHYYPAFYPASGAAYVGSPQFQQDMSDDEQHGRIPIISMVCGDSLEEIARELKPGGSGNDKRAIDKAAAAIAQLRTPVLVRFYFEFDLDVDGTPHNNNASNCFNTSLPVVSSSGPSRAGDFVAAWEAIHNEFANAGARNVTWLWCPTAGYSNSFGSGNSLSMPPAQLAQFLPPASYVDWIGADVYDWGAVGFAGSFDAFYNFYTNDTPGTQPIAIAEAGESSLNTGGPSGGITQATYFNQVQSLLPSSYPQVKAFVYFDAPGRSSNDWSLHSGSDGYAQWIQMSGAAYFAPTYAHP